MSTSLELKRRRDQAVLEDVERKVSEISSLLKELSASEKENPMIPIEELPEALKQRRKFLDIGQDEAAALSNVSKNTYRAVELEEGNPTLETLKAVGAGMNYRIWIEML